MKVRDCEGAYAALIADIYNVSRWGGENMIKNMEEKKNFQL